MYTLITLHLCSSLQSNPICLNTSCVTSAGVSPLLFTIEPKYLKLSVCETRSSEIQMTAPFSWFSSLKLVQRYSVLERLKHNILASNDARHRSKFVLISALDSAINTISSVNSIHQGTRAWMVRVITSKITIKIKGFNTES